VTVTGFRGFRGFREFRFLGRQSTRVCCEAVRSAILATAWLLVYYPALPERKNTVYVQNISAISNTIYAIRISIIGY